MNSAEYTPKTAIVRAGIIKAKGENSVPVVIKVLKKHTAAEVRNGCLVIRDTNSSRSDILFCFSIGFCSFSVILFHGNPFRYLHSIYHVYQ